MSYQTRVLDWPGNDNAGQIQRVMTTTFATTDNTDIRSSIYNASKETEYAFTFEDLVLDPASFVHPCSAGDLEIQSYGGDSALGDHIFKVSGSCRVDGHQRGNETVTACDMSGLCTDVTASPMDGLNATPPGQTPDDPIIGETGSVTLDGTIDKGISALITYQGIYTEPVVVAFLATFNEPEPVDVRVRNLTISGFEIFMEEPGGDLTHASETVNYIVMESGRYTLDGGLVVEAGKCDTATVHVSGMAPGGDNVAFNNLFYV